MRYATRQTESGRAFSERKTVHAKRRSEALTRQLLFSCAWAGLVAACSDTSDLTGDDSGRSDAEAQDAPERAEDHAEEGGVRDAKADIGSEDLGSDGANMDVGDELYRDQGTDEPIAPAEQPDFPQVPHHGGPVLASIEVVPVFFSGDSLRAALDQFNQWVLTSQYWTDIGREYGIGAGTMGAAVEIPGVAPAQVVHGEIPAWIASQVDVGTLPAPNANTAYVIFYPEGTTIHGSPDSCSGYFGYHDIVSIHSATFDSDVPFAVIPRCGDPSDQLTITTNTASHEYLESATDPFASGRPAWLLNPTAGDPTEAWLMIGGGELSDMCTNEPYDSIEGFRVQHAWSNVAAAAGLNPCQPSDPSLPYFTVFTSSTVYSAAAGTTLKIVARAWSNGPTPPWTIGINTTWTPKSDFDGMAMPDKTLVAAGDDIGVTVQLPAAKSDAGEQVYRFTIDSLDSRNLNFYHPWPVMVVVQ